MNSNRTSGEDTAVVRVVEDELPPTMINPDASAFISSTSIPIALFALSAIVMFLIYRSVTK